MMAMVMWSEVFGKKAPEGSYRFAERYLVLETRPDKGYKDYAIDEALHPYVDGVDEKGFM